MSKTLYHSELVKRGEATVKVLGDVTQSKYQGRAPFVALELDGVERLYNVENEKCEGKFLLRKGESLTIKATGTRESADIEILSGGASAPEQAGNNETKVSRESPAQPAQASFSTSSTSEQQKQHSRTEVINLELMQRDDVMRYCLDAADTRLLEFFGKPDQNDPEDIRWFKDKTLLLACHYSNHVK